MDEKQEQGKRFARIFPSPHMGWSGSGTIIGISYDEALKIMGEVGRENEILPVNPEAVD